MLIVKPEYLDQYVLLDSGGYKKLEKFGKIILSRPGPQAVWDPSMPEKEWEKLADAIFKREGSKEHDKGEWYSKEGRPAQWFMDYQSKSMQLKFRLGLSSFKH